MKLVHGKRVRGKIRDTEIKDGKLCKGDGSFDWYFCQNKHDGAKAPDRIGYECSYGFDVREDGILTNDVELYPIDSTAIEDIYVGCKIKDKYGIRKVLAKCGELVGVSEAENHDVFAFWVTLSELKEMKYTLVPEVEPEKEEVMIEINGKKWSASTIQEALKHYVEGK